MRYVALPLAVLMSLAFAGCVHHDREVIVQQPPPRVVYESQARVYRVPPSTVITPARPYYYHEHWR